MPGVCPAARGLVGKTPAAKTAGPGGGAIGRRFFSWAGWPGVPGHYGGVRNRVWNVASVQRAGERVRSRLRNLASVQPSGERVRSRVWNLTGKGGVRNRVWNLTGQGSVRSRVWNLTSVRRPGEWVWIWRRSAGVRFWD